MTACLVPRFPIVCSNAGNCHVSGCSFSYIDLSLVCTIVIMNNACLTLTMANAQASVKFPSWMVLLYLAHLGYLDWRSKGGGIESRKNEPYCAPLLSSFSPARFLGFNPFSLFSPHPFSSLVNPLEWRNIFFVEQETISRFKGGQSGKPMGTIVISEKKAEPPVAITTVLCQD